MKSLPRIALLAKREASARLLARKLVDELGRRGADVLVDEETARALGTADGFARRRIPRDRRLVVSLGGDGTLLSAARAASAGAEILGVNLGTLGFLTGISRREVRSLADDILSRGTSTADVRRLLEITVTEAGVRPRRFRVLNDAVLQPGRPLAHRPFPPSGSTAAVLVDARGRTDHLEPDGVDRVQPLRRRSAAPSARAGLHRHADLTASPRTGPSSFRRASGWRWRSRRERRRGSI